MDILYKCSEVTHTGIISGQREIPEFFDRGIQSVKRGFCNALLYLNSN